MTTPRTYMKDGKKYLRSSYSPGQCSADINGSQCFERDNLRKVPLIIPKHSHLKLPLVVVLWLCPMHYREKEKAEN
jgi:hypothetical protein